MLDRIFGWLAVAVIAAIVLAALAGCAPAAPERGTVYSDGQHSVELFERACTDPKVLAHVPPDHHKEMKAGRGLYAGKPYSLCWTRMLGDVIVVWEDGGTGFIPEEHRGGGI